MKPSLTIDFVDMDPTLAARFARQKDRSWVEIVTLRFTVDPLSSCKEKLEKEEDVVEIGSQADHKKQLDPVLAQRWVDQPT